MVRDEFKVHRDAAGKRRRKKPTRARSEVGTVTVDPLLWKYVRDEVDGDWSRVEVISATEVRIVNPR